MRSFPLLNAALLSCAQLFCADLLLAQTDLAVEEGKAVFRSNCAFCHGLTGRGGRGPNLVSGKLGSDEQVKAIVRAGVPGTTMPSFESMEGDELDALVKYLRFLAGSESGGHGPVAGDAQLGHAVYAKNGCAGCHRVGGEGSVYGPDLTRIGAGRSAEYLRESLLKPSADIPDEYQGVTVVTREGRRISGIRVNEDTFSVQLRDLSQQFRMFDKAQVREVIHETKSLMPAYDKLPPEDLTNLLAYLDTLRGDLKAGAGVKKAKGIQ
jgi:cytochrome c oxidase cbb3-type subunit III